MLEISKAHLWKCAESCTGKFMSESSVMVKYLDFRKAADTQRNL